MKMELKDILAQVADGSLSVEAAEQELKQDSYEDLSFAKVDHSREARSGALTQRQLGSLSSIVVSDDSPL
jgi:NCAIR mutase (PurE)-related protein